MRIRTLAALAAGLATSGLATSGLAGCTAAEQIVRDAAAGAAGAAAGTVQITDASWQTNAGDLRGRAGTYAFDCPPSPGREARAVWGSGPYTDDSSVCAAGVHAGAVSFERGGRVRIQMRPGQNRYVGSARNGVTTSDYGSWEGSFAVVQ